MKVQGLRLSGYASGGLYAVLNDAIDGLVKKLRSLQGVYGVAWGFDRPGCFFFFVVAPFCSCPASLVSRNFFAVGPGCAKCFFFVALRRAPRPFGGARAKRKHHPGCFFFAPAPGKGRGSAGTGPEQKKTPRRVFFFLLRPRADAHSLTVGLGGDASARRGHSKKKNPGGVFFFLLRSRATLTHSLRAWVAMPRPGGATAKNKTPRVVFFFCCAPPGLFR